MGRPLRAYGTADIIEMSDSDICDVCAPVILTYIFNNPSLTYGTTLRINSAGTYDISRGSATDTRNASIGTHPASNSTISTYTVYQNERVVSPLGVTVRPVHYVANGSENRIVEMTDEEIYTYVAPAIVESMIAGGQAGYYLGTSAPGTGTWTSVGGMADTYYNASNVLTSDAYTLWQRSNGAAAGTIRPLKLSGALLVEMSDAEIQSLAACVGEYIRNIGIGQYAFQTAAPASGTWLNRGAFTNTVNNLVDTGYTGDYPRSFTGSFTGGYTGYFTGAYAGNYVGYFTGVYAGAYTGVFTGAYVGNFTGVYAQAFTGAYSGTYASVFTGGYVGAFTGVYAQVFSRLFTGSYSGTYSTVFSRLFTGLYNATSYAGTYSGGYAGVQAIAYASTTGTAYTWPAPRGNPPTVVVGPPYYTVYYTGYYPATWTGSYTGYYSLKWTGAYSGGFTGGFAGAYAGSYQGNFTGAFTGIYNQTFSGGYTGNFTGSYSGSYVGNFTGVYAGTFSGAYTRNFTGGYAGAYAGTFTGSYSGVYSRVFSGAYNQAFTRLFTAVWSGLTVQSATTTTTTTLWVRSA